MSDIFIRPANNADCKSIINLITTVYAEYGEEICLTGADADLLDIESKYVKPGGMFWVLQQDGNVVGSHGLLPLVDRPGVCQFKRLYLAQSLRGGHWGHGLMQVTIDWAVERGFERVEFWSDTRFERAHKFFEKFNFSRDGRIREMFDGVEPYREYFYSLDLTGSTSA